MMEPVWGFILYLFLLAVVVAVAATRKLAWWAFLLLTPIAGFGLAILGSLASGGNGMATGWMGFSSLLLAFFLAVTLKSRVQKLADGDHVDGYKKCPHCAEQVRVEALKCRYCSSSLVPESAPPVIEVSDADAMNMYGITRDGDGFRYRTYRYNRLSDAVEYAKGQQPAQ
jgi:hypothetical protein